MNSPFELVIFGANGLIGKSLCQNFLMRGLKVVAADVNFSNLKELKKEFHSKLLLSETDATCIKSVDEVFKENTKCNKIINLCYPRNKGYGVKLEKVSSLNFVDNVAQNLSCYFNVMKSASEFFRENGGCNLINFASIYGIMPPRFDIYDETEMTMPVEYSAIKSAIIHMSRYFAKYYLKNDIKVNCISPGGVFDGQDPTFIDQYNKHTSSSGLLQPSDLNDTCAFLLYSKHITGQNLVVDSGFSL